MEKEHTDGLGSLFLLLLAIVTLICCLELGSASNTAAAKQGEERGLVYTVDIAVAATPATAKAPARQHPIL